MKSPLPLCSVPLPMATSVSNPFWYLSLITFQSSLLKDIPASASCVMQMPMQIFHRLGFPSHHHPSPMPWTPLSLSLSWLPPCSVFLSYSYQHISFLFTFWYEKWSEVREALWQRNHEMSMKYINKMHKWTQQKEINLSQAETERFKGKTCKT